MAGKIPQSYLLKVKLDIAVAHSVLACPTPRHRTLDDQHNVAAGIQDFLICIEMFFAALAHAYAFPPRVSMAAGCWGMAGDPCWGGARELVLLEGRGSLVCMPTPSPPKVSMAGGGGVWGRAVWGSAVGRARAGNGE